MTEPDAPARKARKRKVRRARKQRLDPKVIGQAARTYEVLRETYPDADCALHFRSPFELLVSTILSAQCTDARVNLVTPALFAALPTPAAMAAAPIELLETLIRSTGFFHNKAKNLKGCATRLVEAYGGEVPSGMDDLLTLPGVARKTANVVRGVAFQLADGVVVDTHVLRLSHRLGWANGKSPEQVERELMALFPREIWIHLAHMLTHHGRRLCSARKPRCTECPVHQMCPSSLA
jgi:endonuclease III